MSLAGRYACEDIDPRLVSPFLYIMPNFFDWNNPGTKRPNMIEKANAVYASDWPRRTRCALLLAFPQTLGLTRIH